MKVNEMVVPPTLSLIGTVILISVIVTSVAAKIEEAANGHIDNISTRFIRDIPPDEYYYTRNSSFEDKRAARQVHFLHLPKNEASPGRSGGSSYYLEFPCRPRDDVEVVSWARLKEGSTEEETISIDGTIVPGFESKYELRNTTNLAVKALDYLSDGQRLQCDLLGATVTGYAYLIVISAGASCEYALQYFGHWSFVSCLRTYHGLNGRWSATMAAFEYPSGVAMPTRNVTIRMDRVEFRTDYLVEDRHVDVSVGFYTYFGPPPDGLIPQDDAQNFYSRDIPSLVLTLNGFPNPVIRGPYQMRIYPKANQYYVDDVITCEAKGYSPPEFQWKFGYGDSPEMSNTSQLVITPSMAGLSGQLVCTATNTIYDLGHGQASDHVNATIVGTQAPYRSYFTRWPVNQVTIYDEQVIFDCTPVASQSEVLFWARQLHYSPVENNVIYDGHVIPEFEGQYALHNQSDMLVNVTSAQRVKCGLLVARKNLHAFLIAIEEEPICGHNMTRTNSTHTGEFVHMWCEVRYSGLWGPLMTWGVADTHGDRWELDSAAVNETSGNTVRYSLYLQLTGTYNLTVFQCKTHFLPPDEWLIPPDDDNNAFNRYAPSWTHLYLTERFYVY